MSLQASFWTMWLLQSATIVAVNRPIYSCRPVSKAAVGFVDSKMLLLVSALISFWKLIIFRLAIFSAENPEINVVSETDRHP